MTQKPCPLVLYLSSDLAARMGEGETACTRVLINLMVDQHRVKIVCIPLILVCLRSSSLLIISESTQGVSPVYFQIGTQSEITGHLLFPLPLPAFFEWPPLPALVNEPFLSVVTHLYHSPGDCAAHVPSGNTNPPYCPCHGRLPSSPTARPSQPLP